MAEYIERETVIRGIEAVQTGLSKNPQEAGRIMAYGMSASINTVKTIPAADVAPVRHGRWENSKNYKGHLFWCSICNHCDQEKKPLLPQLRGEDGWRKIKRLPFISVLGW